LARPFTSAIIASLLFGIFAAPATAQIHDSAWTVRGGTYAGSTIRISRTAAANRSSRFWLLSTARGERRIVGWNPSRLPASVAFRPGRGIGPADSTAFWAIVRRMEEDMGIQLFQPATLSPGSDPEDVVVVDIKPMSSADGMTLVTWTSYGLLYDARVFVRSTSTLHDSRVVTHEMMHALGFGHTSAWPSVMNPRLSGIGRLSAEDVAYAQRALASRAEHERADIWTRLALAIEREPGYESLRGEAMRCAFSPGDAFEDDGEMRYRRSDSRRWLASVMSCAEQR